MEQKYQRTSSRPYRGRGQGGGYRPRYETSEDREPRKNPSSSRFPNSPIVAMFSRYAAALDAINDRYEMLVKNSRDVTIESKRIIFLLIRCAEHQRGSLETHQILSEARERVKQLQQSVLKNIALLLDGEDPYFFNRAFTPGIQEYIECLSMLTYLESGSLIPLDLVQQDLRFTSENDRDITLLVSPGDFLLGIGDLTGELMRFSITHAASPSNQAEVFALRDMAQAVLRQFQSLPYGLGIGKDLGIKIRVMLQSVTKIERVCYQLALRQAENLPPVPGGLIMPLRFDDPVPILTHDDKESIASF